MVIESIEAFRVTRNAITERHEEQANDLLAMIESSLRERKFAETVRLEVNSGINPLHRGKLAAELGIDEEDIYENDGLLGIRDMMQIAAIDRPTLHFPRHHPVDNPELLGDDPNIFHTLRRHGDVLLEHPFESFDSSVERFLEEASTDPKVLGIKMTLYRTAKDSNIIRYLIDAARNGKQVAVVVELMARFDESANIRWANRMEEAGIHVTYGVVGLKTHCKLIFVLRKDYDGLKRYAHIGTGNYHSGTARAYCDLGVLTCRPEIGADLTELFNYLTSGYTPMRQYNRILPSPKMLKMALLEKISREIDHQKKKLPALIQLKTNALEDADVVAALYSRIYYFKNNGDEEYFIGSADLMKRNLESRVEVCVPIEGDGNKKKLRALLDAQLANIRNVWEMQADGSWQQRRGNRQGDEAPLHKFFIKQAGKRWETGCKALAQKRLKKLAKRRKKER